MLGLSMAVVAGTLKAVSFCTLGASAKFLIGIFMGFLM